VLSHRGSSGRLQEILQKAAAAGSSSECNIHAERLDCSPVDLGLLPGPQMQQLRGARHPPPTNPLEPPHTSCPTPTPHKPA
jgi:hypothetical protein